LACLVVQLISRLMWLFFCWLKLILMSRLLLVQTNSNIRRRAAERLLHGLPNGFFMGCPTRFSQPSQKSSAERCQKCY
jgi:hypothetical protein